VETTAQYFDGNSSQSHEVSLAFSIDGFVRITGTDINKQHELSNTKVASRLGNTPRSLVFPDGSKCLVADNDLIDSVLIQYAPEKHLGFIHSLESKLHYVVIAVLFTALFSWGMVTYGIPAMAKQIAYALPQKVDQSLGSGTLDIMDKTVFEVSTLAPEIKHRLTQRFQRMRETIDNSEHYQLKFRGGKKIGANAFALPSGIIIITDKLVETSENDDEVIAILAHEIGHLVHRHSVRMALQNSAVAVLIATVTGDPFSTSSIVVALPTVMINAQYSQAFETEADDYAFSYLKRNNIPLHSFADILLRITSGEETTAAEKYLSTHPGTMERVARFQK